MVLRSLRDNVQDEGFLETRDVSYRRSSDDHQLDTQSPCTFTAHVIAPQSLINVKHCAVNRPHTLSSYTNCQNVTHPPEYLTVYYQNVRGMRTKTQHFLLSLSSCDYDVIVLTETWLREDILNSELSTNYTIYRCDRNSSSSQLLRGGGVLIAIKNNLTGIAIKMHGFEHLEQTTVRVSLPNLSLYICCIYLRPNSDPDLYSSHASAVQQVLDIANSMDRVLVVGDYNLPHLRWTFDHDLKSYLPENATSEQEISIMETMVAGGLYQICSLSNMNGRTLDLAFVNNTDFVELFEAPTSILKVDPHHKPFVLRYEKHLNENMVFSETYDDLDFDFNRCDMDDISADIEAVNWQAMLGGNDLDHTVPLFYGTIYRILHSRVPKKRVRNKVDYKFPWWNARLGRMRNVLRKQRKHYYRYKTEDNKIVLRQFELQYETARNNAFRDYLNRIENSLRNNPSTFWTYVKSRKRSVGIPVNVFHKDVSANSASEAVNLFADYFRGVFNSSPVNPSQEYIDSLQSYSVNLPLLNISETEVMEALSSLDSTKGPGPDRLPPVFLKRCARSLAVPVNMIFNRSIIEHTFPSAWKVAAIVPIHKNGYIHNIENYRGISILNCLAKVLEKFVYDAMYSKASQIIADCQHGVSSETRKPFRSSETNCRKHPSSRFIQCNYTATTSGEHPSSRTPQPYDPGPNLIAAGGAQRALHSTHFHLTRKCIK
ncbi:uncharacterized protein LOC131426828 [Malaya genurostris]|uniref:uncharacterized protein LOC131426828 n=1 Tax=Malaya genurostris TaxID=325434 RepID=UPI0026F3DBE7|nr:uncharacterized protein LOC131426828 [Malaya genurostris]